MLQLFMLQLPIYWLPVLLVLVGWYWTITNILNSQFSIPFNIMTKYYYFCFHNSNQYSTFKYLNPSSMSMFQMGVNSMQTKNYQFGPGNNHSNHSRFINLVDNKIVKTNERKYSIQYYLETTSIWSNNNIETNFDSKWYSFLFNNSSKKKF